MSLFVLSACHPATVDKSMQVLYQQPPLELSLSPASAPVETPLHFTLTTKQPIVTVTGELTGISMYMGLIPLRFQKLITGGPDGSEQWRSEFMLGACSDPAMIWQLNLTLLFADGQKLSINERFSSSW